MAKKKMTINGKSYAIPEFTMADICALEDNDINLIEIMSKIEQGKYATVTRFFVALAMGDLSKEGLETAQKEFDKSKDTDTTTMEVIALCTEAVTNSGFFRTHE